MSDRFLSKAKRVDNGEWVIGSLMTLYYPKRLCITKEGTNQDYGNTKFIEVIPETACHWIINEDNQDIFEGDEIAEWSHDVLIRTFIAGNIRIFIREYDKAEHSAIWKLTGNNIHDTKETFAGVGCMAILDSLDEVKQN